MTATTPNEAYSAWKARTPLIKIYPTKPMGGAMYIEDMLRAMPFLNVIATGNINIEDVPQYLKAGASAVGIGHCAVARNTLIDFGGCRTRHPRGQGHQQAGRDQKDARHRRRLRFIQWRVK